MRKHVQLNLGWRINDSGAPTTWLIGNPLKARRAPTGRLDVAARSFETSTAILAQSGSGKSFLVGRLLEELLVQTRAKLLVFDPNGDFRRVGTIVGAEKWATAAYDSATQLGWLPTELTREQFASRWKKVPILVESNLALKEDAVLAPSQNVAGIAVPWGRVPAEFLVEEVGLVPKTDILLCHQLVNSLLAFLAGSTLPGSARLSVSEMLEITSRFLRSSELSDALELAIGHARGGPAEFAGPDGFTSEWLKDAWSAKQSLGAESIRQYTAAVKVLFASGIFCVVSASAERPERLRVVDLASLSDPRLKGAVVSSTLADLWRFRYSLWCDAMNRDAEVDARVPMFVVVDEAHYLIPRDPAGQSEQRLLAQFRQVATEGRKYGIYLILVTQRPDRLDSVVAGECSNIAIMRLNSQQAIDDAVRTFSLDGSFLEAIRRTRGFPVGRVLLLGDWCPEGPIAGYVAGRRTVEGGRNLRTDCWARRP